MLAAVVLAFIAGCGKVPGFGGDVALVKNGYLGNEKSITVGQIFDKYKYFKSTSWKALKSERGQRIVEFTGEIDLNHPDIKSVFGNIMDLNNLESSTKIVQFIINADKTFRIGGSDGIRKLICPPVVNRKG
jgi:hypothetical protein